MAPPQEDRVANEIRNIRALTENQSALLGGENADLQEGSSSTGFEGATPRKQVVSTPNPLATPLRAGMNGAGATPRRPGETPLRTPRDSFALNAGDREMSMVGGAANDMRLRELSTKHHLKQSLASLPKPKETEWELEIPEDQQEIMVVEETEEDAAIRDQRERAIREAQEQLERKRRTQVMQRGLPRPESVDFESLMQQASSISDPVEAQIAREAALLVANDAAKFPSLNSRPSSNPVQIPQIDDALLDDARLQILVEVKSKPTPEEVRAGLEREGSNALLLGLGCYEEDEEEEQVAAMKAAFEVSTITLFHFYCLYL